jgi:hypothetical protein
MAKQGGKAEPEIEPSAPAYRLNISQLQGHNIIFLGKQNDI